MTRVAAVLAIILVVMIQTIIIGRLHLLQGTADLMLMVMAAFSLNERVSRPWIYGIIAGALVGFISAVPDWVPIVCYLSVILVARLFRRRVWQIPVLAMFIVTFTGTIITNLLTIGSRALDGVSIPIIDAVNLVILPSALLNMILSLPVYAITNDFTAWMYPIEVES
ncbi:MAG TPA: hypothetical protein VIO61_10790 [Anaerolineaceae bacterium]